MTSKMERKATQQRRSFGGRAGTWFRKRKPLEGDEDRRSKPKLSYTSGSIVIGWDDSLCRPIYQRPTTEAQPPTLQHDNNERKKDEATHSACIRLDFSSEVKATNKNAPGDKNRDKKKFVRSYGTARKKPSVCDLGVDDSDIEADEVFVEKVTLTYYKGSVDFEDVDDSDDDDTPNEATCQTTFARRVSQGSCRSVEKSRGTEFEFIDDVEREGIAKSLAPQVFETPRAASLRVAREFFEKLDREHQLTIADEPSTGPRRRHSTTGRSSYGKTAKKSQSAVATKLMQEYDDYKAACAESSVSPIPKATFVRNRSRFFESSSEFHDGFLDEEE
jgi:hypothetical protein